MEFENKYKWHLYIKAMPPWGGRARRFPNFFCLANLQKLLFFKTKLYIAVLVVNYGISNTNVLEIP